MDESKHPEVTALCDRHRELDELAAWLRGAEFADERGHLPPEESARFARERRRYPWRVGALRAHEDRVRLDQPRAYDAWARQGLADALARDAPAHVVRRWRERCRAHAPTWRLDRIEHPPRGDLYDMEQRVTWRITEVATGRVALELEGCEEFEYVGPGWERTRSTGVECARIDGDRVVALMADESERSFELGGS